MAWYSFLTSSTKAIENTTKAGEKIVDGLLSGLDKVWHTPEEQSDARQKASETILKFWEAVAKENTQQSIARRRLAEMTFKVYFFFLLTALVLYGFDKEYAKFALSLAGVITFLVSAIGIIYFGPHQFQKIIKPKGD